MARDFLQSDIEEIFSGLSPSFWRKFSGKRVLLTGGRGFLGRYFTEAFVRANEWLESVGEEPCSLTSVDNLITAGKSGSRIEDRKNVTFVNGDVTETGWSKGMKCDYVIHAAGIASPFYYMKYPLETLRVAVRGLENMLELANLPENKGCRLAFFSSSEIYGDPDAKHVPTPESYRGNVSCLGPRACYDESKRLGETMVRIYNKTHGVPATIIRPFNVYGPGMQKTDYRVLPNFGAKWVDGEPFHLYGTGQQTRTFCYVTDAIRGFLQVLVDGVPGEPYNIGNPNPEISMRNLAVEVGKILNVDVKFDTVEHPDSYPTDDPQRRCPDITKAREQVGYVPTVSLQDGLKRFFGWADVAYREE